MLDAHQDGFAGPAHLLQGEAHEKRDQQCLEHGPGGEGRDESVGDEAKDEIDRRGVLRTDLLLPAGGELLGQVQARSGLDDVADDKPDAEGDRRHREEVAERESAHLADLCRAAHRSDAEHDGAEDDGADHHLDEVDEPGAQPFELDTELWGDDADRDAKDHGDDDSDIEVVGAITADGSIDDGVGHGVLPEVAPRRIRVWNASESGGPND